MHIDYSIELPPDKIAIYDRQIKPHIRFEGSCWIFTGCLNPKGYGDIRIGGRKGKNVRVHRWMWEAVHGPMGEGLVCDHLCRNRACCNPDHIEAVTSSTNTYRGFGQGVINASKTHCPAGHPYTTENTRHVSGARRCRECLRSKRRIYRAKLQRLKKETK